MSRFPTHFAAAFAAITITLISLQTIVAVPVAQAAVLAAPAIA